MSMRSVRLAALLVPVLTLAGAAGAAEESLCTGITVLDDATGDVQPNLIPVALPVGLPFDWADLASVQVAQPPAADGVPKLVFTLKLGAAPAQLPPSAAWYISFNGADKRVHGVRMSTDNQAETTFISYVASPAGLQGEGDTDGRFIEDGTEKPADAASNITGDTITIIVPNADVGAKHAGDVLAGFNSAFIQALTVPGVVGFADTFDQMPDDLGRRGEIKTTDNKDCEGKSAVQQMFGGALGGLALLPLLGFAALRRARR
ncbi:MAG TPA: hypothetical protein VM074_12225 [Solimonas sp.]|nr:hypothetical protein [Solimonas sp.]